MQRSVWVLLLWKVRYLLIYIDKVVLTSDGSHSCHLFITAYLDQRALLSEISCFYGSKLFAVVIDDLKVTASAKIRIPSILRSLP